MSKRHSVVDAALDEQRLGTGGIAVPVLTSAAPLLVVAGIVTTGWAVTGVEATPLAFVFMALLLAVFAVGYMAMARRVDRNSGALYTYSALGLGRPIGVAVGLLALVSYCTMQIGAYGYFGPLAIEQVQQYLGREMHWGTAALIGWLLVGIMGLLRIDIAAKILAAMLALEIVFVLAVTVVALLHPAGGHLDFGALNPTRLTLSGLGVVLAIAWTGFVGFEQGPVYSEESRSPRRTVPAATFLSLALMAGLYAVSSWAMSVAVGSDHIVEQSQQHSIGLMFVIGEPLGVIANNLGHLFFLTSVFAGLVAFHATTVRYTHALAREGVLPRWMARTWPRTGSRIAASALQSLVALVVIVIYMAQGWDPVTQLMFFLASIGGVGVLLVVTITSLAIVVYFWRQPGSNALVWLVAPAVSALGLLGVAWLCLTNYSTLLGVDDSHPVRWIGLIGYAVILVGGLSWGLLMKWSNLPAYQQIGHGAATAPAAVALSKASAFGGVR
ncbi:MAG: APC family permease [Catenulispora sp.]|nr:APC family permease [Catenulispora sp.]NUT40014.1 APC family permease [Thermoactinospora sp.]